MTPATGYRGRFAPSPTGPLHFGSLLTAFASWLRARREGGAWLVRIEDLDPLREVPGASADHVRTLQAFGMDSDEEPWRQSERSELYAHALSRMLDTGLAFECRCSRSDVDDQGGIHRQCLPSLASRTPAIRARVTDIEVQFDDRLQGPFLQRLTRDVGDFVLRRVDGWHAYQLAVVVDDDAQRITEVVRGCDLLDSTPRQIWLQHALGLATPAYLHLPLALDADGRKLGKSLAALPLDATDPLPALRAAWQFLGQDGRAVPSRHNLRSFLAAAVTTFDVQRIPAQRESPALIPATPAV